MLFENDELVEQHVSLKNLHCILYMHPILLVTPRRRTPTCKGQ